MSGPGFSTHSVGGEQLHMKVTQKSAGSIYMHGVSVGQKRLPVPFQMEERWHNLRVLYILLCRGLSIY